MDSDDLECLVGTVDDIRVYADARIPNQRDIAIESLIERARQDGQLQELVAAIKPRNDSYILNLYARRMATLAVRRGDAGYIRVGLLALSVARQKTVDSRNDIRAQALLWRSCELLGLDPKAEFEAIPVEFNSASTFITSWLRRSPADKQLAAVGYIESSDDDGFLYRLGRDYSVNREDDDEDDARTLFHRVFGSVFSRFHR